MKKLSFVLAIFFSIFLLQSCTKDQLVDQNAESAPKLPSVETFIMPFDDFSEGDRPNGIEERTVQNWGYAVGNILIWNSLLSMNLHIPVLSFVEAFNHEAEYQGSGIWLWAYDVTDENGDIFEAKLYGELLVTDEVKWDMYISKVGGFQNIHWYSGLTANDESYAHWAINFDTENPKPFINIDFEKSNGTGSIRCTNTIPNSSGNGGYIEFRKGNEAAEDGFNRAYDVYKVEIDNLLEINWDGNNKNGRVKDLQRYNDTEWHCWDTNGQDTDC
jgi:hypothetical protein